MLRVELAERIGPSSDARYGRWGRNDERARHFSYAVRFMHGASLGLGGIWVRRFIGAVFGALAIVALTQAPALAAEEVICGKILGSIAPTATTAGAFVIPKLGVPAPDGNYIGVAAGTQFSYAQPPVYVCVRATLGGPVIPVPGSPSGTTFTFIEFVAPGAPGYRAEPTPAPRPSVSPSTGQVGTLPGTSTESTDLPPLVLFASGLVVLASAFLLRRRAAI